MAVSGYNCVLITQGGSGKGSHKEEIQTFSKLKAQTPKNSECLQLTRNVQGLGDSLHGKKSGNQHLKTTCPG